MRALTRLDSAQENRGNFARLLDNPATGQCGGWTLREERRTGGPPALIENGRPPRFGGRRRSLSNYRRRTYLDLSGQSSSHAAMHALNCETHEL
jgi:hypothetical protein